MDKRHCKLHIGSKSTNEEIKPFDDKTWQNVCSVKHVRLNKTNASSSKYYELCKCLPDNREETYGYHSSCYSKFTSISITHEASNNNNIDDSAVGKVTPDVNKAILRSQVASF